jgi:hypothetical protein
MAAINLGGTNLNGVRNHFQVAEGMSAADIDQIVADARDVFSHCLPFGQAGVTKVLIYGNIQSGKTAVILALLAIAADNGYMHFAILTSDLNDLYAQTLDRTKNTLHGLVVLDKNDMRQPVNAQTASPCVLVVSKNVGVLQRARAIVSTPAWATQNILVVDDEADQASLDTTVNRPQAGPSGVNREITGLRNACSALGFVQTTATPQALLLQDAHAPYRPDFVHVTTPGTGYCGGDIFFISEDFNNPRYLRFVPLLDVQTMRATQVLPASIEDAILEFVIAAAALRLLGSTKNYQALLHTSLKRDEHELVTRLVHAWINQITIETSLVPSPPTSASYRKVMTGLRRAYRDITTSVPRRTWPIFRAVLHEIAAGIPSTEVIQINSATGQGIQVNPNRRHIINVGGAKLGRGVTIKNLLMTYYARDAINPQIDTVLQHARMYGYRQRELPFTRIFLPRHLADRFRAIHISDNSMRELARSTGQVIPVIPIPLQNLKPSRRSVLSRQSVELTTYIGGRQYYPLLPVSSGAVVQAQTAQLNAWLSQHCPAERHVYDIPMTDFASLLNGSYGQIGGPGAWDDDLIRQAVGLLAADPAYAQCQIVVGSRSSDVSKLVTRGQIPQIQALLPANAGNPPYRSRPDRPVLVFMRLKGQTTSGWDGIPFWVPNIRFPDGNYAFSLNRT